jgi:hypothetical protein
MTAKVIGYALYDGRCTWEVIYIPSAIVSCWGKIAMVCFESYAWTNSFVEAASE